MNRLTTALLAYALISAGCAAAPAEKSASRAIATAPPPRPVRILAIGDSLTHGEGVTDLEAWPHRLTAAMTDHGYDAHVDVVAGTGWTARRAAAEMDRIDAPLNYDLVFVQVGINDHFHEFGFDNYLVGLGELAEDAILRVSDPARVAMLSIVDWRVTPYGEGLAELFRSPSVAGHNAALATFAAEHGFRYLDVTTPSLAMADDPSLIADDDLHPSSLLHDEWVASVILPSVLEQLGG
jgi:acyl-CoA thioesterase-1